MTSLFTRRATFKYDIYYSLALNTNKELQMNTSYGLNTYRSHELSISMRTSSGDTINFDFANSQAASLSKKQNDAGSETNMKFSSMQAFSFSMDTNGISEQDQKEIDAFMKIAQPYIDSFLEELQESAPKSPVTKIAKDIASVFEPSKERTQDQKSFTKANIVNMFDNSINQLQLPQKNDLSEFSLDDILKETQKLLEKTLKEFDHFNQSLYA